MKTLRFLKKQDALDAFLKDLSIRLQCFPCAQNLVTNLTTFKALLLQSSCSVCYLKKLQNLKLPEMPMKVKILLTRKSLSLVIIVRIKVRSIHSGKKQFTTKRFC